MWWPGPENVVSVTGHVSCCNSDPKTQLKTATNAWEKLEYYKVAYETWPKPDWAEQNTCWGVKVSSTVKGIVCLKKLCNKILEVPSFLSRTAGFFIFIFFKKNQFKHGWKAMSDFHRLNFMEFLLTFVRFKLFQWPLIFPPFINWKVPTILSTCVYAFILNVTSSSSFLLSLVHSSEAKSYMVLLLWLLFKTMWFKTLKIYHFALRKRTRLIIPLVSRQTRRDSHIGGGALVFGHIKFIYDGSKLSSRHANGERPL